MYPIQDIYQMPFQLPEYDMKETSVKFENYELSLNLLKKSVIFHQEDSVLPFQEITLGFFQEPAEDIRERLLSLKEQELVSRIGFEQRTNVFPWYKVYFDTRGDLQNIIPHILRVFNV
jgi:hypothetical protein